MRLDELAELFLRNADWNFVAHAISPWHAHGIDVALNMLASQGVEPKGIVLLFPSREGNRLIAPSDFTHGFPHIRFVECDYEHKSTFVKTVENLKAFCRIIGFKREDNMRIVYVANTAFPDFNFINIFANMGKRTCVHFLTIDEGAGSYILNQGYSQWAALQIFEKGISSKFHIALVTLLSKIRRVIRCKSEEELRKQGRLKLGNLLEQSSDGMVQKANAILASEYAKVLKQKASLVPGDTGEKYRGKVILCTDPLIEAGAIEPEGLTNVYGPLFRFAQKNGYPLIIKPHPREQNLKTKYSHWVFDVDSSAQCSLEQLICKEPDSIQCVIAGASSVLATSKALYGIPVISLAKILLNEKSLSDSMRETIGKFIEVFQSYISFPESEEELEVLLAHCAYADKKR